MFDYYKTFNGMGNEMSLINLMYDDLQNFTTPGFKTSDRSFEELMSDGVGLGAVKQANTTLFTQGKVRQTGSALDLAIQDGEAGAPSATFFVISDGSRTRYTRAGHFAIKEGKMVDPFSNMKVQGFALDQSGNKKSDELKDISLDFDPVTKLYGGMYTGFKFGEGGKLMGEVRITDPLTNQSVSKTVPIYQVALASFSDPRQLAQASATTYEATDESGKPSVGVPGEGNLMAQVAHESLEMSNADIPAISQNMVMARMAYDAQLSAFKAMNNMTQTAANLVK